ncbi:MAG: nucleotidyltransferase domain-containing protein [Campylobacterales bacterium]|nr:nucleotidyltransferase domain-containing protein [Campylobacterales bacterium]
MTLNEILQTLRDIKPEYETDGVSILGVFGSYARNQASENSDIDVLIETNNIFMANHPDGFSGFTKLSKLREELESTLKTKVDIVDKTGLLQHGNTHILQSAVYV